MRANIAAEEEMDDQCDYAIGVMIDEGCPNYQDFGSRPLPPESSDS